MQKFIYFVKVSKKEYFLRWLIKKYVHSDKNIQRQRGEIPSAVLMMMVVMPMMGVTGLDVTLSGMASFG